MKAESALTERAETGTIGSPALVSTMSALNAVTSRLRSRIDPLSPSHSRTLRSGLTFIVSSDRALDYMRLKVNGDVGDG